ncbi:PucR family transcriptional regulator ligand-binding domain-containing protein [Streptomyces canus]|uniref:PucR family transcriptional regulator n=1 Tax=Streptomyces canus TaxID=58343 RepID=UPI0022551866|nr:PucR family transcriptional regulator ligand-binding domain-containing protein [Streptomyces canus]MCX5261371.1 PucR family transcriptional regulator ligand-binding domain-containing protein [Streptomyces canus]
MPDPAVPPTPPVPLAALLAREDLGLRQIAGPANPSAVVHWAHTSEMADPYPYLLGGELLLTAGVHIPEAAGSGTYFDDYVSRIVAAGGAALGFGVAPVHDTVPRALVAACDSYELPLIEVPPRTTFAAVARAVWQLMAQARHTELRRVTEAQQSLAAAASRPDPVPSVLRRLAQRVGGWAVLYGPDGTEVAVAGRGAERAQAAGGPEAREVREALAGLARIVRPTATAPPAGSAPTGPVTSAGSAPSGPVPSAGPGRSAAAGRHTPSGGRTTPATVPASPASATDTVAGVHLSAYSLGAGHGFVLGLAAPQRDPGDHTIASVAAVLLSLLTGEHQSGSGAARSSALVRLLLGAPAEDVAPLLGGERWVVVHARPDTLAAPDPVAASALGAALGSPLVDVAREVVRVLLPADPEPAPQPGWTLGVSAVAGPREWAAADVQAGRALARARATRAGLVRYSARPALADLVPEADAAAHARALLARFDATPALTETLRTWLSLHGSWDRTAVALDVHRNTVRQRIAKCAALLELDLDDPDVRMELWFALRRP